MAHSRVARDSNDAEAYRNAWLETIKPAPWDPELDDARGVMADRALLARAAHLLAASGTRLVHRYPYVHAVALSWRYRERRVWPNEPCLTFFVTEKLPSDKLGSLAVPPQIDGLPTDVVAAGRPQLHAAAAGHTQGTRSRPVEPRQSISHHRVSSGTYGCLVKDALNKLYVLSCAHVLSDGRNLVGDAVVQPGPHFGGSLPADQIAMLTQWIPLISGASLADAAIAEVTAPALVTNVVRYIGRAPAATRTLSGPSIGLWVQKSGDTTGHTAGVVIGVHATIGGNQINGVSNIDFTDAVVTTGMSEPGDSGSLLMDYRDNAIGLLFGGLGPVLPGQTGTIVSYFNPIEPILVHLHVQLA